MKTHQFVTVNPEQMVIQTNITKGPVTGSRVLTLSPSSDINATKIDVLWNIDMSGIPVIVKGLAKDNFMKTTEALQNCTNSRTIGSLSAALFLQLIILKFMLAYL